MSPSDEETMEIKRKLTAAIEEIRKHGNRSSTNSSSEVDKVTPKSAENKRKLSDKTTPEGSNKPPPKNLKQNTAKNHRQIMPTTHQTIRR
jgi:hypothetical protein